MNSTGHKAAVLTARQDAWDEGYAAAYTEADVPNPYRARAATQTAAAGYDAVMDVNEYGEQRMTEPAEVCGIYCAGFDEGRCTCDDPERPTTTEETP